MEKMEKMENTKNFMLIFRFEPNNNYVPSTEEINAQHLQWSKWIGRLVAEEKFISTSRLGFDAVLVNSDHSLSNGLNICNNQIIGGNLVLKANDFDEAAKDAQDCPILLIGGNVEVREIIPM